MKKSCFVWIFLVALVFLGCARRGGDPNAVVVWHWMNDRQDAFEELARKYEEQTNIKIKFELYAPPDVYSQKIIAAAQARVLPDVFGILEKKAILSKFIKNEFVVNLTDEFKKDNSAWENSFFPEALAVNRFEEGNTYNVTPGIYGVPIDVTNMQMLYNKKLLAKAGIKRVPETFSEFLSAIETLKRVGIPGMVSGWGELWLPDCFASNYAFNIMGEEKIMATYKGEVPYTDPDWIKVFEIFEKLQKKGALVEGIVSKTNKFAEQDFALGRAAFAFNGSWCVNVYHEMNKDLEYGVMLPPSLDTAYPMKIWGGAGSSFMVNSQSSKKDKAIAFLKWLSAKEQQAFLSQKTKNLPANREALEDIPGILSEFAAGMEHSTHPKIWSYNEDSLVAKAFDKGLQYIIIGEKTPKQVAEEIQAIKQRQMEKKKRRNH